MVLTMVAFMYFNMSNMANCPKNLEIKLTNRPISKENSIKYAPI